MVEKTKRNAYKVSDVGQRKLILRPMIPTTVVAAKNCVNYSQVFFPKSFCFVLQRCGQMRTLQREKDWRSSRQSTIGLELQLREMAV